MRRVGAGLLLGLICLIMGCSEPSDEAITQKIAWRATNMYIRVADNDPEGYMSYFSRKYRCADTGISNGIMAEFPNADSWEEEQRRAHSLKSNRVVHLDVKEVVVRLIQPEESQYLQEVLRGVKPPNWEETSELVVEREQPFYEERSGNELSGKRQLIVTHIWQREGRTYRIIARTFGTTIPH